MVDGNTDDFFQFFRSHMTDGGHYVDAAIDWWFDGTLRAESGAANETTDHTGFYGDPPYTPDSYNYIFQSWNKANNLADIRTQLMAGRPVGLAIYSDGGGAHAVTCWGFNYDSAYTPADTDYYVGVWLSDSDSHKGQWNPPDMLRYYAVEWDSGDGRWEMPNYGGGWYIWGVTSLEIYPGATRPTANSGGAYTGNEGSPVTFDASGSSDDAALRYRWDFDEDGVWDTGWLTSATTTNTWNDDYPTGNVYLEVFDNRLRDMDITTVTINNVPPAVTANDAEIDENGVATVTGTITDPGTLDTFTAVIDWGEGSPESFTYPAGTTSYSETHQYLDDDPTSTASDDYTVTVTVTDDDGGAGTATATVTVNNVAPVVTANDTEIDENGVAIVTGTITDPGTLDTFTAVIDWGEGSPESFTYPAGTTSYSETHQYLDDNPTGTVSDDYTVTVTVTDDDGGVGTTDATVTVNNLDPVVTDLDMDQPNEQFVLPGVHELHFTGVFTDVGTQDTHTATWDWGDGSPIESGVIVEAAGSGSVTGAHTYSTPGDYTVLLTVTDDDTGQGTMTYDVHVVDVDEALEITNDYIQNADDEYFDGKADKRKAALDNMFSALNDMWVDGEYNGMINDMRNNIREKADGSVDGKANNDWILDSDMQTEICHKIDDITAYLEMLL